MQCISRSRLGLSVAGFLLQSCPRKDALRRVRIVFEKKAGILGMRKSFIFELFFDRMKPL
jgi:hypothetical protein